MSYWTYSDLFEEPGPPSWSFHGGFGLLNREGIRKPAFFAYKYLHALEGAAINTADTQTLFATKNGGLNAVIWDFEQPRKVSNRCFYTKVVPAHSAPLVRLQVTHLAPSAAYRLKVYRTGYQANDAYSAYLEMGAPKDLNATQVTRLNDLTRDLPERGHVVHSGSDGTVAVTVPMYSNDVVLLKLAPTVEAMSAMQKSDSRRTESSMPRS